MWYGCLNSSSAYTTHIPTLRRWISSLSLSKSGPRSIQNYSFTVDPSTSRRPSGVTYRSGFARKESTSALPFSAPASRRTAKLSCFFIPIITFLFSTTWCRHDAIRPSLPSFGRSGLKQVSSATSTLAFLLPRWQKILGMILERIRQ